MASSRTTQKKEKNGRRLQRYLLFPLDFYRIIYCDTCNGNIYRKFMKYEKDIIKKVLKANSESGGWNNLTSEAAREKIADEIMNELESVWKKRIN